MIVACGLKQNSKDYSVETSRSCQNYKFEDVILRELVKLGKIDGRSNIKTVITEWAIVLSHTPPMNLPEDIILLKSRILNSALQSGHELFNLSRIVKIANTRSLN